MNIRNFKPSDFETICSWYSQGLTREQMPEESSFVLLVDNEPQVCVSVYLTNTSIAYCENMTANPEFKNRKEAVQKIMEHAWNFAKQKGYKYAVGFTSHEKLANRHLEMGWDKKINNVFIVGKEL